MMQGMWRKTGKPAEVVGHMCLIEVTAVGGKLGERAAISATAHDSPQCCQIAAEAFEFAWWETEMSPDETLEVSRAVACFGRQFSDRGFPQPFRNV